MLILNCGGTLNKRYNPLNGLLEVPVDNLAMNEILASTSEKFALAGLIYKDSLDMDAGDRKSLADIIMHSDDNKFLVVHGTDTMDLSAAFLDGVLSAEKCVVLTGAMQPFSIDRVEATLNIGMSIGFLKATDTTGVFICMNGYVEHFSKIRKNKILGRFEIVS